MHVTFKADTSCLFIISWLILENFSHIFSHKNPIIDRARLHPQKFFRQAVQFGVCQGRHNRICSHHGTAECPIAAIRSIIDVILA